MQNLQLYNNQLTGAIPAELGNLTRLKTLNLGGNQLTGTVPTWLGGLTSLEQLYLWSNQLSRSDPGGTGQPDRPHIGWTSTITI